MQRGRDGQGRQRLIELVAIVAPAQHPAFEDRLGQFLDKEGTPSVRENFIDDCFRQNLPAVTRWMSAMPCAC